MKHSSVFGLLLLCVLLDSVNAARSSSHYVHRRDTISNSSSFSAIVGTRMSVSPAWYLNVGDTIEINCTAHSDKNNKTDKLDLQLVWTKMGDGTKKVLASQQANQRISYVLGPVTHEHSGVYTCGVDRSLPNVYFHDWHSLIWVQDTSSPRASIDVTSHNRSQFFSGENFTVSCQLPEDNSQWKMMRVDLWAGNITECPNQVSSGRRLSCDSRSQYPWSDKLYWCESSTGERSNALNITSTVAVTVVLESPPLPVLEGEDVMLRCLHRNRTTKQIISNFRTFFYKNRKRIGYNTEGSMTLTAVTKADEGIYKCRHLDILDGGSFDSWITVKPRPDEEQKKTDETS